MPGSIVEKSGTKKRGASRGLNFWVKVAAIAVPVVAVLALIVSIVRRDGTSVDKSVASHDQKGGVTAQTQNDNSVTSTEQSGGITAREVYVDVKNYYGNQSPDERQALNQKLLAKYPRGYAVFGVEDGKSTRTIEGLSFEKDFEIVWTGSEIAKFEPNCINYYPPQIIYKPTKNGALGVFNLRIERTVGFTIPYPFLPKWTNIFIEVLDDKESFAVLVLGFK